MKQQQQLPHHQENWNGYSLDELKYRRAYLAARCELEKERLRHNVSTIKGHTGTSAMSMVRRVSTGIPMLNYSILAFSIGKRAWKLMKHLPFRKKKK